MEADNSRLAQGICPLTNGWLNHIRENWHDFSLAHLWLILTIVPITLVMGASAVPTPIVLEANKLNNCFSNTVNFLSLWGFMCSFSSVEDLRKKNSIICQARNSTENNTRTVLNDLDTPGTDRDRYLLLRFFVRLVLIFLLVYRRSMILVIDFFILKSFRISTVNNDRFDFFFGIGNTISWQ